MNDLSNFAIGYSDGDVDSNRSDAVSLESLAETMLSRRQTMKSGVAALTTAVFASGALTACGGDDDGGGGGTPDAITVNAGEDGTTSTGRLVTLASTSTGPIVGTRWEQISGPSVTLINPNSSSATFIAPSVTGATVLGFRVTITGNDGQTVTDEANVTVQPAVLGFDAVAKNLNDIVTVPAGYTVSVLYRLGDPIKGDVAAYANNGTDTNFAGRAGDHHDGMSFFGLAVSGGTRDDTSNIRGLLAMNHENITQAYLHANGPTAAPRPEAEAIKEIEAHGVSVIEVGQVNSSWNYAPGSTLNRRVTPNTPVVFNGPVRGSDMLRTVFSPAGTDGRGTINNCANGYSAWGTYLTCEENWAGYFRRDAGDNAARSAAEVTALNRYGVNQGNTGNYAWTTVTPADGASTVFRRWNATVNPATPANGTGDFRNEPNHFGWVVEIDPYDPALAPRKRTALGRLGHEGAWPGKFVAGRRPAFYMGDDARREYLYKFVSNALWDPADAQVGNRLGIGDKYLDAGTLYVARFDATGSGVWLPLVFGTGPLTPANGVYPFQNQADVLTHARLAADAVGATPMDRPEWTAINPVSGEMYLTLTNNNAAGRPLSGTDAANPRHYNDPKGPADTAQRGNPNGHIVRLREAGDTTEATSFTWDIYLFGAGADLNPTNINISVLNDTNDFSSPDGLWFGRATNPSGQIKPLLWIQTDDGAYTDKTNNQMLAALPGTVGDGSRITITNVGEDGTTRAQETIVGAAPGTNLRRFLVGPKQCEITGIDSTPDGRSLFVNVQHPGEEGMATAPTSNWPANQDGTTSTARPRSATIVITRDTGGVVGL